MRVSCFAISNELIFSNSRCCKPVKKADDFLANGVAMTVDPAALGAGDEEPERLSDLPLLSFDESDWSNTHLKAEKYQTDLSHNLSFNDSTQVLI